LVAAEHILEPYNEPPSISLRLIIVLFGGFSIVLISGFRFMLVGGGARLPIFINP
jgi:hypothetical protein